MSRRQRRSPAVASHRPTTRAPAAARPRRHHRHRSPRPPRFSPPAKAIARAAGLVKLLHAGPAARRQHVVGPDTGAVRSGGSPRPRGPEPVGGGQSAGTSPGARGRDWGRSPCPPASSLQPAHDDRDDLPDLHGRNGPDAGRGRSTLDGPMTSSRVEQAFVVAERDLHGQSPRPVPTRASNPAGRDPIERRR